MMVMMMVVMMMMIIHDDDGDDGGDGYAGIKEELLGFQKESLSSVNRLSLMVDGLWFIVNCPLSVVRRQSWMRNRRE